MKIRKLPELGQPSQQNFFGLWSGGIFLSQFYAQQKIQYSNQALMTERFSQQDHLLFIFIRLKKRRKTIESNFSLGEG